MKLRTGLDGGVPERQRLNLTLIRRTLSNGFINTADCKEYLEGARLRSLTCQAYFNRLIYAELFSFRRDTLGSFRAKREVAILDALTMKRSKSHRICVFWRFVPIYTVGSLPARHSLSESLLFDIKFGVDSFRHFFAIRNELLALVLRRWR